MLFSKRNGYVPVRSKIQIDSIDNALRNSLWSACIYSFWDTARKSSGLTSAYLSDSSNRILRNLCDAIWLDYFKQPLDTRPNRWKNVLEVLRDFFFKAKWYEVYDFIEFLALNYGNETRVSAFCVFCNSYLKREMAAFRFVSNRITKIVNDEEIDEIETASSVKMNPVQEHLRCSIALLSDRKSPDYRNSIKESISAVEALALSVLGEKKGTLGALLTRLEEKTGLHPALKSAFSKLYGYTSDADGIRHALLEESVLDYEDAKFMLVSCSAFINYVMEKV